MRPCCFFSPQAGVYCLPYDTGHYARGLSHAVLPMEDAELFPCGANPPCFVFNSC